MICVSRVFLSDGLQNMHVKNHQLMSDRFSKRSSTIVSLSGTFATQGSTANKCLFLRRYGRHLASSTHELLKKKHFLGPVKASKSEDHVGAPPPSQFSVDGKAGKFSAAASLESMLERSAASLGGGVCQSVDDERIQAVESWIERRIFDCRFFTLMAVIGSLAGSFLCFTKGCRIVFEAFKEYARSCWIGLGTGKVILLLVEAVDVYLIGTVMLIFGMGLYELFVSALEVPDEVCLINGETRPRATVCGSNFFGLFRLRERPRWLEIHSLDELKTKLGHVIVMILLVGMFEKSKKVVVHSAQDLLFFSLSILMSSGSLFLLSKLNYREMQTRGRSGTHLEK